MIRLLFIPLVICIAIFVKYYIKILNQITLEYKKYVFNCLASVSIMWSIIFSIVFYDYSIKMEYKLSKFEQRIDIVYIKKE